MNPANDQTTVPVLSFLMPIKTVSEANAHEHWRKRQARAKAQRAQAALLSRTAMQETRTTLFSLPFPLLVTMTRISPRCLDSDNLQGALKHCRDGIADWLLVDDRECDRVTYVCEQEIGTPAGVRVDVRAMTTGEHAAAKARMDAMRPKTPSKRKAKAVP